MHQPRPLPPLTPFRFMELAKRYETLPGTFLAGSTMEPPSHQEAGFTSEDFDLMSPNSQYGHPASIAALSKRFGAPPESIVMTGGASEANALVYQALLQPGDEVLAETPGYEVFHYLPQVYGAKTVLLPRRIENDFVPDLTEFKRLLTPKTRLVVLTNLHNPTMALLPPGDLKKIISTAADNGTYVLVDEIYLDHLKPGVTDSTCFHYGDNVIVTSSLTKVYGVGVLRCGWAFAPKALAKRLHQLHDLTSVQIPYIAMNLGARLLQNADRLRPRARIRHERGMAVVRAWAATRPDIKPYFAQGGITVAAQVEGIRDSWHLADWLASERQVLVAPGGGFQMPDWIRIKIAKEPEWLKTALNQLAQGIDGYRAAFPT